MIHPVVHEVARFMRAAAHRHSDAQALVSAGIEALRADVESPNQRLFIGERSKALAFMNLAAGCILTGEGFAKANPEIAAKVPPDQLAALEVAIAGPEQAAKPRSKTRKHG